LSCVVKALVTQYSRTTQSAVLDVGRVRIELAKLYEDLDKFSLNHTADSMEALDAILQAIHRAAALEESQDGTQKNCLPICPAHETVGLRLYEHLKCKCGSTSEPMPWDNCSFNLNYYVHELLSRESPDSFKYLMLPESSLMAYKHLSAVLPCCDLLAEIYKKSLSAQVIEQCASHCSLKSSVRIQQLHNSPTVLSFSLVWPDRIPTQTDTLRVLSSLPDVVSLSDFFEGSPQTKHLLKGMILFTPGHYISMFRETKSGKWLRFDDNSVRLIEKGADKFEMLADCLKNHLHPVGVFYEECVLRQDYTMTQRDWLVFEKWTLENDLHREELRQLDQAMHESLLQSTNDLSPQDKLPPNDLTAPEDLKSLSAVEDSKELPTELMCEMCEAVILKGSRCLTCEEVVLDQWLCECGEKNTQAWLICQACNKPKPGEKGWVCEFCTCLNTLDLGWCSACFKRRKTGTLLCTTCTVKIEVREKRYCASCGEDLIGVKKCSCQSPPICLECRCKLRRCPICKAMVDKSSSCCVPKATIVVRPHSRSKGSMHP
jgi:hypothetical protein